MKIIVTNGRWRTWVFEPSDRDRAERFAKRFGLQIKEVSEIPYSGYTVWVGKEDLSFSNVEGYSQRKYDTSTLFI